MTSTPATAAELTPAQLGTLTVIAWTGEPVDGEQEPLPFLLAYSLGDGIGGPEAGARAVRLLLARTGLPVGTEPVDASAGPPLPVTLLVQAGQVVLTMPYLHVQSAVPPEWLAASRRHGRVYFMFTTRPWPQAAAGRPVSDEALRSFVGDEETLKETAHVLLPVSSLR
ncbi:DUF5949 family protein [Streptomyces sannanensis]|uniref:DUF5949 family protein n=1 Tax=Streptomyces sannanensis TaxID=285536 RepID=A0ABP6SB63_9ACTN